MDFPNEPSAALDLHGRQELLELIQQIVRERNIAIVLCGHLLTEMEHVGDDLVILNLGQAVVKGHAKEPAGQVPRKVTPRNCMHLQVPPAAVLETRQVLEGMTSILIVTRVDEVVGWLEMELFPAARSNSVNPYQVNGILRALIRAKIPIISFGSETGHFEKRSLNLGADAIR